MTAGPPAGRPVSGYPADGRTLARWWGQLGPLSPRALWVGRLDLTHLDALARVARLQPLDPLHRLLLRAVDATTPTTLDRLDARVGLGRAPLFRWLRDLTDVGLLQVADNLYALTAAGSAALAAGTYVPSTRERRRFTFADVPGGAPHFLPWRAPTGRSTDSPLANAADVGLVAACAAQPADWKRSYGFPDDVIGVESADPTLPAAEAWPRVVVARSERVQVALAIVAPDDGPERLLGYATAGDTLAVGDPALELAAGWATPFPELTRAPDADEPHGLDAPGGWRLVGEGRLRRAVEGRSGD
jgi:hypothetical protein